MLFFVIFAVLFQISAARFDNSMCGVSKLCVFKPTGCIPYQNCAYALSYYADNSRVYMEILGQVRSSTNVYVAVGFSTDNQMGKDSVIACTDGQGSGRFSGILTYNGGKDNKVVAMDQNAMNQILTTTASEYQNGTLYCQVQRSIQPGNGANPSQVFDLSSPYYIFLASGPTSNGQLQVHETNEKSSLFPYISPGKANLLQMQAKSQQNMGNMGNMMGYMG